MHYLVEAMLSADAYLLLCCAAHHLPAHHRQVHLHPLRQGGLPSLITFVKNDKAMRTSLTPVFVILSCRLHSSPYASATCSRPNTYVLMLASWFAANRRPHRQCPRLQALPGRVLCLFGAFQTSFASIPGATM